MAIEQLEKLSLNEQENSDAINVSDVEVAQDIAGPIASQQETVDQVYEDWSTGDIADFSNLESKDEGEQNQNIAENPPQDGVSATTVNSEADLDWDTEYNKTWTDEEESNEDANELRQWNWRNPDDEVQWAGFAGPRRRNDFNPRDCISTFQVFQQDLKKAFESVTPEGRTEYTRAAVFYFHFRDTDLVIVPQRDRFLKTLREEYNFETETYEITDSEDHDTMVQNLRKAMRRFRHKYGRLETGKALVLVCYGGHGSSDMNRELTLSSGHRDIFVPLNHPSAASPADTPQQISNTKEHPGQENTNLAIPLGDEEPAGTESGETHDQQQNEEEGNDCNISNGQFIYDPDIYGSDEFWKAFQNAPSKSSVAHVDWFAMAPDWRRRPSFDCLFIFDCCSSADAMGCVAETLAASPGGRTAAGRSSITDQLTTLLMKANGKAFSAAEAIAMTDYIRHPSQSNCVHIRLFADVPSVIFHKINKDDMSPRQIQSSDCYKSCRDPSQAVGTGVVLQVNITNNRSLPTNAEWEKWLQDEFNQKLSVQILSSWESDTGIVCMMLVPYEVWSYITPRRGYSFASRHYGMLEDANAP